MSDTVRILGVRGFGLHGVLQEEKREAQPFVVDVEMEVEPAQADSLNETVSYADVAADALAVIEGETVDLIETLADRIAARVIQRGALSARVTVHKPEAPVGLTFSDVSVTVRRNGPLLASGTIRRVVIALGSNVGDGPGQLDAAIDAIGSLDLCITGVSGYQSTDPVLAPDQEPQPRYTNAVMTVTTAMSPLALLDELQRIEVRGGRVRNRRWGPRTIDLDVIDVEGIVSDNPRLTLPHPRAGERVFVLEPWAQIEPDATLGGMPVVQLLEGLRRRAADSERPSGLDSNA